MIKVVGLPLARDEQVDPAVVIVVGPAGRVGIDWIEQTCVQGDVCEVALAIVSQQRRADNVGNPRPAGDEDVEVAVVVVIGLVAHEPAKLVGDSGRLTTVYESPVAGVVVIRHGLGDVVAGDRQIEPVVAVEIVHDGSARLVVAVHANAFADVAELADVKLGMNEAIELDQVARVDLVGVLAQGHVGEVQEPLGFELFGEALQILSEMLDRQPRAVGLGVDRRMGDRQDARAFAAAHDAVVVFPLAKGGRSLEIDDAVEPLAGQGRSLVEPGPQLAQLGIGPSGLCFVIEEGRPRHFENDPAIVREPGLSELAVNLIDVAISHPLEVTADLFE